jgi:hypothetical protein
VFLNLSLSPVWLFSITRVVTFDFLVSFSIVIIETPHISAPRYFKANAGGYDANICGIAIACFGV